MDPRKYVQSDPRLSESEQKDRLLQFCVCFLRDVTDFCDSKHLRYW